MSSMNLNVANSNNPFEDDLVQDGVILLSVTMRYEPRDSKEEKEYEKIFGDSFYSTNFVQYVGSKITFREFMHMINQQRKVKCNLQVILTRQWICHQDIVTIQKEIPHIKWLTRADNKIFFENNKLRKGINILYRIYTNDIYKYIYKKKTDYRRCTICNHGVKRACLCVLSQ